MVDSQYVPFWWLTRCGILEMPAEEISEETIAFIEVINIVVQHVAEIRSLLDYFKYVTAEKQSKCVRLANTALDSLNELRETLAEAKKQRELELEMMRGKLVTEMVDVTYDFHDDVIRNPASRGEIEQMMKDYNIVEYNIPPKGGDPDMDIVYKLTGLPEDVARAKLALREKCDAMSAESKRKKQRGQQIDKYWTAVDPNKWRKTRYIYEFEAKDIDGNMIKFEKYRGYPLLIVNVASRCGGTDRNYKQLTALYEKYADKGLKILAFPCNQFHNQEPYIERDIKEFASTRYGVKFDMYSKIHVLGPEIHPLYNWLVNTTHGTLGDIIKWNFTKFIVDKKGRAVQRYGPNVDPEKIEPDIPKYL
ncbi:uncharacterized protein [Branchiostoma lanceolatum]|uniref:uncharacterized protein isoform X1 n=1 Tax=Branchiostoma lanceolatum TaxID=7740 RepID=UPI003451CE0D